MENASFNTVKKILFENKLTPRKCLGQNFLIDENILKKIVKAADIQKKQNIIEIGSGLGHLTAYIASNAKKVISFEIDERLASISREVLSKFKNIKIISADVLTVDIYSFAKKEFSEESFCIVANIPYYITTPLIIKIFEAKSNLTSLTIMTQKEVAKRFSAKAGQKEYGAISVFVNYYSNVKILFNVSANCFFPKPKVESSVIKMDVLKKRILNAFEEKFFFSIVRASFNHRRKTLVNSTFESLKIDKDKILKAILKMGINKNIRGEELSIKEFLTLSNELIKCV